MIEKEQWPSGEVLSVFNIQYTLLANQLIDVISMLITLYITAL